MVSRATMTEQQKRAALASIAERAAIAERAGLMATVKSWRELHWNVGCRPAAEIIMAERPSEVPQPE